jgi:glycosyltransferase involved in cell wall biosynthesis
VRTPQFAVRRRPRSGLEDVQRNVTVLVKTYERPDSLRRLVASIRRFYPAIPILVVDDSEEPLQPVPQEITRYIHLPHDSVGVAGGRNYALRHVETEYVLISDDDLLFESRTDLGRMLGTLRTTRFGVVSCKCLDHDPWRPVRLGFRRFEGSAEVVDDMVVRRLGAASGRMDGLPVYDVVAQFFMARTDTLGEDPWDASLAVGVEHVEFFWQLQKRGVLSTLLTDVVVQHYPELPPRYHRVRARRREESFREYAHERGFGDKFFVGRAYTRRDRLRYYYPSLAGYAVRHPGGVLRRLLLPTTPQPGSASTARSVPIHDRTVVRLVASGFAALALLIGLPEALGDRPYDPKPSRVFEHFMPPHGDAQVAARE